MKLGRTVTIDLAANNEESIDILNILNIVNLFLKKDDLMITTPGLTDRKSQISFLILLNLHQNSTSEFGSTMHSDIEKS